MGVFWLGFRLHPATPGWGVGVCVCWCGRSLAPRHSWLGCAPWVCVFGLGFRLRPATAGWGVGLCVCWCGRSACTPSLLAGVRAVGVCVWSRLSAAPRHSWLGCWGVCVLVCVPPLYPATPGWSVRCGCVCLGSGFGCAPQLLARMLGCVCAGVRAHPVPRLSWLRCTRWVCMFGLGFWLRPATPGWGVGLCVCSCARSACTPPLLAGVCGVGVCVWARVLAAPRHSWLGCWGVRVCVPAPPVPRHSWPGCAALVCVLGLGFRLRPATPGWGVGVCVFVCMPLLYPPLLAGVRPWVCVCLGSGFGCTPPLLAGVLGCVGAGVGALLALRHSWLGCAPWVCVFGLGFWLHPATPGWGVGLCVCWSGRSACTPPLLAGVRSLGVCVLAPVSAAPRHSWLAFWGVCVLVWALQLHPPILARVRCVGVCVWAGVSAAPRHSWLGCWAVCVLVWALHLHPAIPGCTAHRGVCVFGLGFQLHPANPGLGVRLCVCWCGRSACTAPLLAGVRAVIVCVWARLSAAPRQPWLGCWGVCVLVCVPPLYPATHGLVVRCGCVCLGSGFACAPPLLAEVLGCVCAGVRAPPVPRVSWLGCAAWVCVLGLGFWLRPATPGWAVGLFVCSCTRSACTLPLLAGVCAVGVCVWARVSAAPRHPWPGCAVWVCVFGLGIRLRPPIPAALCVVGVCARARVSAAPRHSWLGFVVCGLAVAWHLFMCRGSLRVCGTQRPSLLGTCLCALVVAGGVPLWRASWPRLVRRASSGPVALGAPVGFPVAVVPFPNLGASAPGFTRRLCGARGGRPRTRLFVPAAGPRRGGSAGLAPRRTRSGPRDWGVPGGSLRRWSAVVGVCGPGH